MSHLIQIKQRIRAIEKTKKITRAMRLIAMSLYSKLEKKRLLLQNYQTIVSSLAGLVLTNEETLPKIFSPEDLGDTRPLIIVCSSSKGLCGGMNSSMMKYFEKTFTLGQQQRGTFIALGRRAITHLKGKNFKLLHEAEECTIPTIPTLARTLTQIICDADPIYTSVRVYYTHLKSFFAQVPERETLIPFDMKGDEPEKKDSPELTVDQYTWEQDQKMVANKLAEHYLYTSLVRVLFHNLISENAARFIAMDQSTNNADKYLESLALTYNKSRQSSITREIAELASNMD